MFDSYQLLSHADEVLRLRGEKYTNLAKAFEREAFRQHAPDLIHDRWRLDLMWSEGKLGLKIHTPEGIRFTPIDHFDNAHSDIIELSARFAATCPHPGVMNLRFRRAVDGRLGLWLDGPRVDLDHLKVAHRTWIKSLLGDGVVVEAGQRFEEWVLSAEDSDTIKSTRPKLRPWLPSYVREPAGDLRPVPLLSTIAAFSQPGPLANQTILTAGHELLDLVDWSPEDSWGEWGAGNGNLTASFAERLGTRKCWISEPDPKSFEALKANHREFFAGAQISRSAAIRAPEVFSLWLLDPPRSGFSALIQKLEPDARPANILIYHCAMDGLLRDRAALLEKGYELREWIFCDVFPGSAHAEAVSLWSQKPC